MEDNSEGGFRKHVRDLCTSVYFQHSIVVVIILNTVFLALAHWDERPLVTTILNIANFVFLLIFSLELLLQLVGFSYRYFYSWFNWVDFIVVVISWVCSAVQVVIVDGEATVTKPKNRHTGTVRLVFYCKTHSFVAGGNRNYRRGCSIRIQSIEAIETLQVVLQDQCYQRSVYCATQFALIA